MAEHLQPTPAERKLIEAADKGVVAPYTTGDKTADDPAGGADWGDKRTIRAEIIYALCLGTNPDWTVHAKGVQARGARIVDSLDFESATLLRPLALLDCFINEDLILVDAEARSLVLSGSHVPGMSADRLVTKGSVFLSDGFAAKGEVRLLGADIGGSLSCTGGSFENPDGYALTADSLKTKGNVFLRDGFTATGEVLLRGADIAGNLECRGGSFENPDGDALSADRLKTKGAVILSAGFTAKGEVRLLAAEIGGDLDCGGGSFENPDGDALSADRLKVKGGVFLGDGFTAKGEVRLLGADIGGNLECSGGSFENPDGYALNADGVNTKGHVFLREGFAAEGQVRLLGADIGRDLDCGGGSFENPDGNALTGDGLKTTGNVFLRGGFTAKGEVRLLGVDIGGGLSCTGGSFENPSGYALNADNAKITGALFLRDLAAPPKGAINLGHSDVGVLVDDEASWPSAGDLILDGFVYGALGGAAPTDAKARLEWLNRQPEGDFRPQPYEQLAKVLRGMGHERDAREIAIAKQEALRKSDRMGSWGRAWNYFLGATIGHGYKPWKALWYILGAVIIGAVVFGLAFNNDLMVPTKERIYLAESYPPPPSQYPRFQPFIYSLDVFLPIVDLHQESYWLPNASTPWGWAVMGYMWLQILLGWVLTTVAVAGLTGLVRFVRKE